MGLRHRDAVGAVGPSQPSRWPLQDSFNASPVGAVPFHSSGSQSSSGSPRATPPRHHSGRPSQVPRLSLGSARGSSGAAAPHPAWQPHANHQPGGDQHAAVDPSTSTECALLDEMGMIVRERPCFAGCPARYDELRRCEIGEACAKTTGGSDDSQPGGGNQIFDEAPWSLGKEGGQAKGEDLSTVKIVVPAYGRQRATLGVAVGPDPSDRRALVIEDISSVGMLAAWNSQNFGAEVCAGDKILSINGKAGSAQFLQAELAGEISELVVKRDFGKAVSELGFLGGANVRVTAFFSRDEEASFGAAASSSAPYAGSRRRSAVEEDEKDRRLEAEERALGSLGDLPKLAAGSSSPARLNGRVRLPPRPSSGSHPRRYQEQSPSSQQSIHNALAVVHSLGSDGDGGWRDFQDEHPPRGKGEARKALEAAAADRSSSSSGVFFAWLIGCSAPEVEHDHDGPPRPV